MKLLIPAAGIAFGLVLVLVAFPTLFSLAETGAGLSGSESEVFAVLPTLIAAAVVPLGLLGLIYAFLRR